MEKHQPVILYSAIFLLVTLLIKMLGLIDVSSVELLAYMFIIFGISYVYITFGNNRKGVLFTASCIFLIGIIIYLLDNFEFFAPSQIIYPSVLFIAGIGFLMIYIDGGLPLIYLFISAGLIIMGLALTFIKGEFGGSFFLSLIRVAEEYWIIVVIMIVVFLLIRIQEKRGN